MLWYLAVPYPRMEFLLPALPQRQCCYYFHCCHSHSRCSRNFHFHCRFRSVHDYTASRSGGFLPHPSHKWFYTAFPSDIVFIHPDDPVALIVEIVRCLIIRVFLEGLIAIAVVGELCDAAVKVLHLHKLILVIVVVVHLCPVRIALHGLVSYIVPTVCRLPAVMVYHFCHAV